MDNSQPLFTGSAEPRPEPELPEPLDPKLRKQGHYVPSEALQYAVDVSLLLGQPLLLTGEPGTGKTTLAASVAHQLFDNRFLEMQVKSTSGREDLLYRIDELARFRDSQPGRTIRPLLEYCEIRPLGIAILRACPPNTKLLHRSGRALKGDESFLKDVFGERLGGRVPEVRDLLPDSSWTVAERWVVLVDEIDKAPRDTPNDLLEELERMAFAIPELGLRVAPPEGAPRPVVIVTSNSEKSLPDAFLRRCAYHHIGFPGEKELRQIVASRLVDLAMSQDRLGELIQLFEKFRRNAQRRPGTAEMLQWLQLADKFSGIESKPELGRSLKELSSVLAKQEPDIAALANTIDEWAKAK